jgi:hypothetical protein
MIGICFPPLSQLSKGARSLGVLLGHFGLGGSTIRHRWAKAPAMLWTAS